MRLVRPDVWTTARSLRYPESGQTCDLCVGDDPHWAIEVKLARVGRDNRTYEDTAVKKILSPYKDDRSAVTDCLKLAGSTFAGRKAILIYGSTTQCVRSLGWIDAFELVASRRVSLGGRHERRFDGLLHSIFSAGGSSSGRFSDLT